jgi:hypothetical protein
MVQAMADKGKAKRAAFKSPATFSGRQFSGILLKPISIPFFPDLTGNEEADAELVKVQDHVRRRANAQLRERMEALARHYELDYSEDVPTLFSILKALATDILPGFQINAQNPLGRRPQSFKIGGPRLFEAVNARIEQKGGSILQACEYLSRHGPAWCRAEKPASLKSAYLTFKRMAIQAHKDAVSDENLRTMIRVLGYDGLISQAQKRNRKTTR